MSLPSREHELSKPYALPPDVKVLRVTELAEHVRNAIPAGDGEFVVTRPGYRTLSRLVDVDTLALLEEFRNPTPIGEAVARFALHRGLDPSAVLEDAFGVLQMFTAALVLVSADSDLMDGVEASLVPGQIVDGFEIRRLVQLLDDTEVYSASAPGDVGVAVKVARQPASMPIRSMFEREAAVLQRVAGRLAPRLITADSTNDPPFLVTEWVYGVSTTARSQEIRSARAPDWRLSLLRLCRRLIETYVGLHELGIVHGDVHSANVLIDGADRPLLLDFGLSRIVGGDGALDHDHRAGFSWNTEPEAAAALARGLQPPPATFAGEQYSVASLLYQMICGEHHSGASPTRDDLLDRVLHRTPAPFARLGFESWPEVEAVLAVALRKDPSDRYETMASLLAAFEAARPPTPPALTRQADEAKAAHLRHLERVLDQVTRPAATVTDTFPVPPTASAQYGAAGLAAFLTGVGVARDSAELLAVADKWSLEALTHSSTAEAFDTPDVGITTDRVGAGSLYHRSAGVHLVRALIARARGDVRGAAEQAEAFSGFLRSDPNNTELAFGSAGLIVGGALLLEATRSLDRFDHGRLSADLTAALDAAWDATATGGSMAEGHLGIAHGLAGVLYSQLRARRLLGLPIPSQLEGALAELAARAEPAGRGVSWPGTASGGIDIGHTPDHAPGWCAGTAGHVHLWTAAHEALGNERYLTLAERAAWHSWEHPDRHGHLCCGLAGRAYGLLRLHQYTGDRMWLHRARQLSALTLDWLNEELLTGDRPLSLYWGALGPLLVAVELDTPEAASMPLFAASHWP